MCFLDVVNGVHFACLAFWEVTIRIFIVFVYVVSCCFHVRGVEIGCRAAGKNFGIWVHRIATFANMQMGGA